MALYRPTRLDRFWVAEKRWYAKAGPRAQSLARTIYVGLLRARLALTGQRFRTYVESYSARGMDFHHSKTRLARATRCCGERIDYFLNAFTRKCLRHGVSL